VRNDYTQKAKEKPKNGLYRQLYSPERMPEEASRKIAIIRVKTVVVAYLGRLSNSVYSDHHRTSVSPLVSGYPRNVP